MKSFFKPLLCAGMLTLGLQSYAANNLSDTTRAYATPLLTKTPKGTVALSWTEKDSKDVVYFYWAESKDKGKTFDNKKLIFASSGIGNSRLMKPKLLFKKDGSAVAVFALRGGSVAAPASHNSHAAHQGGGHGGHGEAAPAKGGRPTDLQIVYAVSKDQGSTWTNPVPVHQDQSPNVVRGFFDATVLANGEIGVAYLNDIPGKAHQRDLRFVSSKGDRFEAERVIDPFVCDCCPISLLVDASGTLNMYYRENQENIRDIFKISSKDNGKTFSQGEPLYKDNWQVNGCPHSGPTSGTGGGKNLIAWFSGSQDAPGVRVVDQQGKRLFVLDDPTAKSAFLVSAPKSSILLWEQSLASESGRLSTIGYKNISGNSNPATQFVKESRHAMNASGLVIDSQLIVAYEAVNDNKKSSVALAQISL
ncbi:sialidase family protein [Larkinella insperata]|uniref:Sialidase family protein n=1 Tax=Larkinella insperata TaxID=332158 RepID=A0ABW3QHP8_9BACT|nr:sialidase family protein [Larkinella insperata]